MIQLCKNSINTVLILFMLAQGNSLLAQDLSYFGEADTNLFYITSALIIVVMLLVLAVLLVLLQVVRHLYLENRTNISSTIPKAQKESWWTRFLVKANDLVPMQEESSILLDHDYDGIRELDNHLPPWWKWMFYLSIVFAVVYIFLYHVSGSLPLQAAEYDIEITEAAAIKEAKMASNTGDSIDENNVTIAKSPSALFDGEEIFVTSCAPCHKKTGAGGIGPNLTDDYWLHGASINEIYKTIKYGVPEKGMIAWEAVLAPKQIRNVSSYILTLKGSNPPDPKAPQGVLISADAEEAAIPAEITN